MIEPAPLAACSPGFARHRGYAPRFGWLLRAHEALKRDPRVGRRPEAPVELGVGSSMVPSMLFWSRAFGLAAPAPEDPAALVTTPRGAWLLDQETGADPYLEMTETLWLLHHWLLTANPCLLPSWRYAFGHMGISRVTRAELRSRIVRACDTSGWRSPAAASVDRDISCLVSMYGPHRGEGHPETVEELVNHPFRQLRLLDVDTDERSGRELVVLDRWAGGHAPSSVILYCALDFALRSGPGRAVALDRLCHEPTGPGLVLRLDRTRLRRVLERAAEQHPGTVDLMENGDGQEQLLVLGDAREAMVEVLSRIYGSCS